MAAQQQDKPILWEAPAYEFREKSPDWFWAVGIITLAVFATALLLKNFLFAILALLSGFSIALYGARRPETMAFGLTTQGVKIGRTIYGYKDLRCFCIREDTGGNKLFFQSKKTFVPKISLPLGSIDPKQARKYLLKKIKEEEIEDSAVDVFIKTINM